MKIIFQQGCFNSVFKRNQSLKELLAPSSYPNNKVNRANSTTSCNKYDICKNYLICSNYFTCSVTNRRYYAKGVLHCNCNNVIYLIIFKSYLEQYVGSATNSKSHFRIHKSDCGTAKHFNGTCKNDNNIFQFLSVQIIEQVCSNATNIEEILWHREKYWQSQLFTTAHGIDSLTDLYYSKRKGNRK